MNNIVRDIKNFLITPDIFMTVYDELAEFINEAIQQEGGSISPERHRELILDWLSQVDGYDVILNHFDLVIHQDADDPSNIRAEIVPAENGCGYLSRLLEL
jgi:hypothetical protein